MDLPLADAFQTFVSIVMFFIFIAGWIGQQVKNRQQGAAPKQGQAQPQERVQDEIERFLAEVTGQKPKDEGGRPAGRRKPARTDEERAGDQRIADAKRDDDALRASRKKTADRRREESTQRKSTRDSRAAADRASATPNRKKVEAKVVTPRPTASQPMTTPRAGGPVASSAVRTAAGFATSGGMSTSTRSASSGGAIIDVASLRNPKQLRQAIILNQIFGRPKALRKREDDLI